MFVVCSDLHFSEKTPINRLDENWIKTCCDKFVQVCEYAEKKSLHIIVAGDFFNKSFHTPELLNEVLNIFLKYQDVFFHIIPGNHDIKLHNLKLLEKSQIKTLACLPNIDIIESFTSFSLFPSKNEAENNNLIDFFPYSCELKYRGGEIAVIHQFSYKEKPWKEAPTSGNYQAIIRKMKGYKLIIAGDNHEDFIATDNGTVFLNCGGMLRQTISEQTRSPKFYHIKCDLSIKNITYDIQKNVFNLEAGKMIKRKNEAIQKVVEQMDEKITMELDFVKNLKHYLLVNKVSNEIEEIINKEIEQWI